MERHQGDEADTRAAEAGSTSRAAAAASARLKADQERLDVASARLATLVRRAADDAADRAVPDLAEITSELQSALQALETAHEQLRAQQAGLERAREQLAAEQARFRELFEVAREGHIVTDPSGVVVEVNRAGAALLNIPAAYLVGKPLAVFAEPDDRRQLRMQTFRSREERAEIEGKAWLRPRGSAPVLVSFAVAPATDSDGAVTSLRWLLRDVSRRRADEVHGREPAALVRAALDAMSAHIAVLDGDGRIISVNHAWRSSHTPGGLFPPDTGVGADYVAGARTASAGGSAGEIVSSAVLRVLHGDESRGDVVYAVRGADVRELDGATAGGSEGDGVADDRWFVLRVARCEGESPARAVVAHEDVTGERRAFEQERALLAERAARLAAEGANQAKSEFLATLSHELRTPLNAIAGYAELMALGVRGPVTAEQAEDLRRILRSEQHLLSLINELLNFARLERGEIRFDRAAVPLAPVIDEVLELLGPQGTAKGVDLAVEHPAEVIVADADLEKVRQILVNLVANAVRFTPAGGSIFVASERVGGEARVAVRDTGIGIPLTKLEAIFDPFVQIHRGIAGRNEGVGLGLAISRSLARAMGGELTVASTPGVGSTFWLSLPLAGGATVADT